MNKEEIMSYVGDLEVETEEIRRLKVESKEPDSVESITRACSVVLTIICC